MTLYKEIEKSFPKMEKLFTEAELLKFSQTLAGHLEEYNFGLGTMIRLYLLRPNRALYREFVKNGFSDKDTMAMEMIKAFHKHLHDKG